MTHIHQLEEYQKKISVRVKVKGLNPKTPFSLFASEFKMKGSDLFQKRRTKEFRSISSHYNEWVKDCYGGRRRYKLLFWTLYVNRP
jgi:hypothetical protein